MCLEAEAEGRQSVSSPLELEVIYKTTTHRQFERPEQGVSDPV